jgi:hypothetical protein
MADDDLIMDLQDRINEVVQEMCQRHYDGPTQEHQLSSRLAQKLEDEIGLLVGENKAITITAQELPDRGRGAAESLIGADLYISLVRHDKEPPISKGMLVQSKWDKTLRTDKLLRGQSNEIYRRTRTGGWLCVFGPNDMECVRTNRTRHENLPGDLMEETTSLGQLIADGLRCTEGDEAIGLPPDGSMSMNEAFARLKVVQMLQVTVLPVANTPSPDGDG